MRSLRETLLSEFQDSSRRVHREHREINIQPCPLRGFSDLYPARLAPNPFCILSGLCALCARHSYPNIQIPRLPRNDSRKPCRSRSYREGRALHCPARLPSLPSSSEPGTTFSGASPAIPPFIHRRYDESGGPKPHFSITRCIAGLSDAVSI